MSSSPAAQCTFCRIIAGEIPASFVHTDDHVTAFMDTQPMNPGHVLVVPKQHYASLAELPETIGAHLFLVAQRTVAAIWRSGVRCEGVRMTLSDGAAAGQTVPHCHIHVFPRFTGDGYSVTADPRVRVGER